MCDVIGDHHEPVSYVPVLLPVYWKAALDLLRVIKRIDFSTIQRTARKGINDTYKLSVLSTRIKTTDI